jgi:hypothetical protein
VPLNFSKKKGSNVMDRAEYVEKLASDIAVAAEEEILGSPLAKIASEEQQTEAVVEKIAGVFDNAAAIYHQASEVAEAADEQIKEAAAVLESLGYDPEEVVAGYKEAAEADAE